MNRLLTILATAFMTMAVHAQQQMCYLTADEVRVDTIMPYVNYSFNMPANYNDSIYTVSLLYPEFMDIIPGDDDNYAKLTDKPLAALPAMEYNVVLDRKKPMMNVGIQPLAFREGRMQYLTSFMLKMESKPRTAAKAAMATVAPKDRYAEHSVLAKGKWAKISVANSGIYVLADSTIKRAGFNDISKVHIYGYGGNLQNERLVAEDLINLDDLKEVPQCIVDGRHLFWAEGPVSWSTNTTNTRTRNPYSNVGCYFITQDDEPVATIADAFFKKKYESNPNFNHTLFEQDAASWYFGGRNLFDGHGITPDNKYTVKVKNPSESTVGTLYVNVSADKPILKPGTSKGTLVEVFLNDSLCGKIKVTLGTYDKGASNSGTYSIKNLKKDNEVKLVVTEGGMMRLDYITLRTEDHGAVPDLSKTAFPGASYVYNITNQDHHADPQADMVIIIPTSQKLKAQAKRLADFHTEHDGLRVNIVPADELFNEFSSGTPDANAYRRYLKMLYDRAENEEDMPKYLLLFGDCVWDNRMLTPYTRHLNADDMLLAFESENSFSETRCYVDDSWFALLDDGEGTNPISTDMPDVGVGRFPVRTAAEAKIMVDKVINYSSDESSGSWQNTIVHMGDDGNTNTHMKAANNAAMVIEDSHPDYISKKVMWDVFERVTSTTGNTYPEASKLIKQYNQNGALIFNYLGHGNPTQLSHENVITLTDFSASNNKHLPLWVTAACDVMPFDGMDETIGESAVLNPKGGAIAFFGTMREVFADKNLCIDTIFINKALTIENGKPLTLGEAHRRTKCQLISTKPGDKSENKLQYTLLGDPAMALKLPKPTVVIDAVNGQPLNGDDLPVLNAGSLVTFTGHIEGDETFSGAVTAVVRDSKEDIVCRLNDTSSEGSNTVFTYQDRTKTLFSGSNAMSNGQFSIQFVMPVDINYSNGNGLINVFAISDDKKSTAHGSNGNFIIGGSTNTNDSKTGPSIYCYLNSPAFVNGGDVNTTPYFVAEINDEDGLNTSGNGIGHDLQLIIDGNMSQTYTLNDNFTYDFGSYTSGKTFYSIPSLTEGKHKLLFRAWDVFNNVSIAELDFNVVNNLKPVMSRISCTNNPATTSTTFIVSHDRVGSIVDCIIDVMDMSGRLLWSHTERGLSTDSTYTYDWDLTVGDGHRLQTGVYLYRVRLSSDQSDEAAKAKKIIIL